MAVGDTHIPFRSVGIPKEFKKILQPDKIHQCLVVGNLSNTETSEYFATIAPDIVHVKGDWDSLQSLPNSRVVVHGNLKIGVIHGHQIIPWGNKASLASVANKLDVDVLISGHTNKFAAFEQDGRYFINPGSATGAFESFSGELETTPSFVLMDIQGNNMVLYVYQLIDGELKVDKKEFSKQLFD